MIVNRGHVARLDPTRRQVEMLNTQGHVSRALWNLLHEWWTFHPHSPPTLAQADAAIRQARHEIDWLAILPAQAAQQVLRQYHRAWVNCWEGRAHPPKFKSRARTRLTVDNPQASHLQIVRLSRRWGQVKILKVGRIRFRWTRDIPGRITGARLFRDCLGWHIAFRTELITTEPIPLQRPDVGIDRGISVSLALSNGEHRTHGPWLRASEAARLLRLERKGARQQRMHQSGQPRSNRRHHTYDQIAAIYARAKRRRYDWQHKITTDLAREYSLVVVEDLRISNMTRSARGSVAQPGRNVKQRSGLSRMMLAEAHARTVELLAYKLIERAGTLIKVPAPYTSLRCSGCGELGKRAGTRFSCPICGYKGHADHNAALNILAAGLAVNGRRGVPTRACATSTSTVSVLKRTPMGMACSLPNQEDPCPNGS